MIHPGYVALVAATLAGIASAAMEEPMHLLPRSPTALKRHLAKRSGTRPPGTLSKSQGCNKYHTVKSGDTCYGLAEDWGIDPWTNLLKWNTGLDEDCQQLYVGYSYCMGVTSATGSAAQQTSSAAQCTPSSTQTATATSTIDDEEDDEVEVTSTKCSTSTSKTPTKTATSSYAFETRNGVFQDGLATWYYTGLGACGVTNTDDQLVAAISWEVFDNWPGASYDDPNNNPLCGKQVQVKYGSKTVTATVRDRCASCEATHIDLTPSAFAKLTDLDVGMMDVKWKWLK